MQRNCHARANPGKYIKNDRTPPRLARPVRMGIAKPPSHKWKATRPVTVSLVWPMEFPDPDDIPRRVERIMDDMLAQLHAMFL